MIYLFEITDDTIFALFKM